ncbi:MAG: carbohydrate ABC transporter permease [Eubacteriales bacterium]|nr:carbohydrate ABC transporter permease [Eubacteriales bacterium]
MTSITDSLVLREQKKIIKSIVHNLFLIALSVVFIYPLVWMLMSCFKTNQEIFGTPMALPTNFDFSVFKQGWEGAGQYSYTVYFKNTFSIVLPVVGFTLLSSLFVAYGFARFNFKLKKTLFTLMIATMMLPNAVVLIPKYMFFNMLEWVDTYLPFTVPVLFGGGPFFIYMLIQFFRGVPRDLDEAATIDGCSSFGILFRVMVPLCKPALFSAGLFQFMWTWNDFMGPLIYINSVYKYPISLGLRMSLDMTTNIAWNQVLAMSLVSILPPTILFFLAQKYFVEGIATSGMKG